MTSQEKSNGSRGYIGHDKEDSTLITLFSVSHDKPRQHIVLICVLGMYIYKIYSSL